MNAEPQMPETRPGTPDLTVVIPVYNEREVLPSCLQRLKTVLAPLGLKTELLFVDDGSRDGSYY